MTISLLSAGPYQCRWVEDGQALDKMPRCCGAPIADGLPYCSAHAARAYVPHRAGDPCIPFTPSIHFFKGAVGIPHGRARA